MTRVSTWFTAVGPFVALVWAAPTCAWSQAFPAVLPGDAVRVVAPARIVIPDVITLEDGRVVTRVPYEQKGDRVVVRDGDKTLHLPRPGRRLTGRLDSVTDEFITLREGRDRTIRIPRQAVERLEVRHGNGHRRTGALLGAAAAFGLGYALGYQAEKDCGGWLCLPEAAGVGAGLLLAIPGAAAGAALGGATERWEPVATERLRVGIAARPGGGTAVVSIRF